MSNKLPSVTSDIPRDVRTFFDRLREIISGTSNDRLVSVQDLINSGIATTGNNGALIIPTTGIIGTPPAPTNLSVTPAVDANFVEWDNPVYFGHDYTEVYSGATNVIGDAVLLGFTPGVNYVDTLSSQQSRYYWARFVNRLGFKGPFNSVTGTLGTTLPEVDHLLTVLTGEITETQLFTDLGARINLIDNNAAGSVNTRIATETTNRTTADSAIVGTVTTLSATVGANTSAIQTETSTRVSETGSLFAKYTVKIDQNGYVSGFGLASTANNATPFSDFIIRADRFSIASPSGPGLTPIIPFIVTTTQSTIDGTVVPAGVYIDGAYIKGGTIKGSAIEGGTITNSKLINVSANKITGAALEATSFIESAAYIAGSQGWKIHANGTAEFAAASIRGQLVASQINANGLSIKDAAGNIILNAGTNVFTGAVSGNLTGTVNGTAASTVVTGAAAGASALVTADAANTKADTAISGLANKLNSNAANVLAGTGGLATGSLTWNSSGVRTGGYGVGFTQAGIAAYNSSGNATFVLNGSTGAATFAGDIIAGTLGGSSVTTTYVRSANYLAGSAGWNIASNGDAEFNTIGVRSGQITGVLTLGYKINSYSGLLVQIGQAYPVSMTNGPYYAYGNQGVPMYLVFSGTMPPPEGSSASHKIAMVVNVQASAGGTSKDLGVAIFIGSTITAPVIATDEDGIQYAATGGTITGGENIANIVATGAYGMLTAGIGATTYAYNVEKSVHIFVHGYNANYTIQSIQGLMWGIR